VKIGAENKKQVYWMIALLAIAIPLAIYEFGGIGTSAAAPPAPASASNTGAKKGGPVLAASNLLDPTLHTEILDASRRVKYEAGGRNIFRMEEPPPPKVITAVRTVTPTPIPTPTPVPPPPPIPLKFYGFASKSNEPKKVFLAEGPSIFVAHQGEIVDRRYKVVQIQNNSVTIEDLLTNNRQPIPLTAR
jgi:hypothetical protein